MATRLQLENKAGEKVSLVLNGIQSRIVGHMFSQWNRGCPVRQIILKGRQFGASTGVQALFYTICHHTPNMKAIIVAQDEEGTDRVISKAKFFHNHLPDDEKKRTLYDKRDELVWAPPHESMFRAQVAGKFVGTAGTYQLAHLSELAKWKTQRTSLASILQTIPDPSVTYKTAVVIESTAQGEGDEFHRWYVDAKRHRAKYPEDYNCYLPLFFSWLDFSEEYAMPVPTWYRWGSLDAEEEETLKPPYNATMEQLYWRRWAIQNKCGGSLDTFHEEYPRNDREAFIASGDHAIYSYIREQHHKTAQIPKFARLDWSNKERTEAKLVPCDFDPNGCWRVFEDVRPVRDYAIGGDVSEGLPVDPNDPHGKRDMSAIMVLDRRSLSTVAMWCGRIDPDLFGVEMLKAGYYFNHAWMSPEVNNAGQSTLDVIRQAKYTRLYQRQKSADDMEQTPRSVLGWRTSTTNRDWLIDQYIEACRREPEIGFRDAIRCLCEELADEEDMFVRKANRKREHRDGQFDDILFSTMIALEVHVTCPREMEYPEYGESYDDVRLGSEFMGGYKHGSFHAGTTTVSMSTT